MAGVAATEERQATTTVREAARLAGVGSKRMRRWIREGRVRAQMIEGKFGPTWAIELSSLPPPQKPLAAVNVGVGQGAKGLARGLDQGGDRAEEGIEQGLLTMLGDLTRRHEAAATRIGQLEGERERRLELEARCGDLEERSREADTLRGRVRELSRERWAWGFVVLALVVLVAAVWVMR